MWIVINCDLNWVCFRFYHCFLCDSCGEPILYETINWIYSFIQTILRIIIRHYRFRFSWWISNENEVKVQIVLLLNSIKPKRCYSVLQTVNYWITLHTSVVKQLKVLQGRPAPATSFAFFLIAYHEGIEASNSNTR